MRNPNPGILVMLAALPVMAQIGLPPDRPPEPGSLKTVTVPVPVNLTQYIVNQTAAIALGKAFFWDQQIGSDGLACASCHFHAGADNRVKNQFDPGLRNVNANTIAPSFTLTASNKALGHAPPPGGGPNYTLKKLDFPTHQLSDVTNRDSSVLFDSDDIVSSQGVFAGVFQHVLTPTQQQEVCGVPPSVVPFNVGGIGTRQVEPRNTPTVINAAFNFRNFWDGRANNIFNGRNPFGMRDPTQGSDPANSVLIENAAGVLVPEYTAIPDSSLASQAVGPPTSNLEMSCSGRMFEDIGKKVLASTYKPLQGQVIDPQDSVLGIYSQCGSTPITTFSPTPVATTTPTTTTSATPDTTAISPIPASQGGCGCNNNSGATLTASSCYSPAIATSSPSGGGGGNSGLNTTYSALIKKAFAPKYWSSAKLYSGDTQMQKNFSLFWGLAIQMYESTLISNDSPFDKFKDGNPAAISTAALNGFLQVFMQKGECIFCHQGAEFTSAATHLQTAKLQGVLIEHMIMGDGTPALYDSGFYNIGVRPPAEDLGVGGLDGFNNPLSFTRGAKLVASTGTATNLFLPLDNVNVNSCNFQIDPCMPVTATFRDAVDGSFKVPSLRNVELTGPYFHNGGRATLSQVIEFYNRGGDRRGPLSHDSTAYGPNLTNLDVVIQPLGLTPTDISNLLAFLTSLTDERVRWERAPFDHPSLAIPNGEQGTEISVNKNSATGQAVDLLKNIPAVGKTGRSTSQGPLLPFDSGLQ
jgi:cytochrome c peroxidase